MHAKTPDEVASTGFSTGKADDVLALTTYQGRLYCTSNHRRGAFVYEGGEDWRYIGPDHRLLSFTVYRGRLYTLVNGGMVYRYEGGAEWSYCGRPEGSIQTYSAATHAGRLYVGTWPEGQVHRYEGGEAWVGVGSEGRVGFEREIMGMALYNGKVYLGSLPMANVWRMDGDQFTFVGNLDTTPTTLRRVWSMAVYRGELFAGTLPSGRVYSATAGQLGSGFPRRLAPGDRRPRRNRAAALCRRKAGSDLTPSGDARLRPVQRLPAADRIRPPRLLPRPDQRPSPVRAEPGYH